MRWLDSGVEDEPQPGDDKRVDWLRVAPFIGVHLACALVIVVGFSWTALAVAVALYAVRMFFITGFSHRSFSHKTFETSRAGQFVIALAGMTCMQRGPLWWAAHHRKHHASSDTPADVHSPRQHGYLWSHVGWITSKGSFRTDFKVVPDLARYPELVFLNRFDWLVPLLMALGLLTTGMALERWVPALDTTGPQLLVWGFFVSTIVLLHASVTINSIAHVFGRQRYATGDDSRNSFLLALLTFGEGWHNNHHYFPASARQGFRWWEIDMTYYGLVVLSWTGLIRDLKPVPRHVVAKGATRELYAPAAVAETAR